MYRVVTPGKYLVKNGEKLIVGMKNYEGHEIDGFYGPAARVHVTNMETGDTKVYFPGQPIITDNVVLEDLTKAEIMALMPDKEFPKKVTKEKLMEAYYGR